MNDQMKETEKAYKAFFNTSEGRKVLADLKEAFYTRNLVGESEYITLVRAGQKDVIQYIINIAGDIDNG